MIDKLPNFNYTPFSLALLRFGGFKYSQTEYAGFALGVMSIIASVVFFQRLLGWSLGGIACMFLSLSCFPMQLAIERGNTDQIIYAGLILYSIITCSPINSFPRLAGAFILSFVLSGLKLFPVATFVLQSLLYNSKKLFYFSAMPAVLAVLSQLFALLMISANTPRGDGPYSYGIMTRYTSMIQSGFDSAALILAKIAILTLSFYIAFRHARRQATSSGRSLTASANDVIASKSFNSFIIGSFTFLATYFIFINWDYRLINLLLCVPLLLDRNSKLPGNPLLSRTALASLIFIGFEGYGGLVFNGKISTFLSFLADTLAQPFLAGYFIFVIILIARFGDVAPSLRQ